MNDSADAEVVFRDVLAAAQRSIWVIVFCTLLGALLAAGVVLVVPKKYEASTVVFAMSSDSNSGMGGGLGALTSQFSGLAALAGVTPQTDARKAEAIAVLQSDQLTQRFISENNLLPILFRRKWDAVNQRWKNPGSDGNPTLWKANVMFRKSIRTINTDTKTGMLTLTISWTDPKLAAKWANDIVKLENDYLRDKAIRESDSNIAYLNAQASKTDVVGIKQVIYSILQNEINKEMIARGSEEYALKVIDPAFAPERPAFPIPALWITIGAVIGLFISIFVATLCNQRRTPAP